MKLSQDVDYIEAKRVNLSAAASVFISRSVAFFDSEVSKSKQIAIVTLSLNSLNLGFSGADELHESALPFISNSRILYQLPLELEREETVYIDFIDGELTLVGIDFQVLIPQIVRARFQEFLCNQRQR